MTHVYKTDLPLPSNLETLVHCIAKFSTIIYPHKIPSITIWKSVYRKLVPIHYKLQYLMYIHVKQITSRNREHESKDPEDFAVKFYELFTISIVK